MNNFNKVKQQNISIKLNQSFNLQQLYYIIKLGSITLTNFARRSSIKTLLMIQIKLVILKKNFIIRNQLQECIHYKTYKERCNKVMKKIIN